MFKKMKLATKMISGFSVSLIIVACIVVGVYTISDSIETNAKIAKTESVVYAGVAREMKLDVVQVQQWLSDISATRAQDGLDDGFKEAEDSKISFFQGLNKFRELYKGKNDQRRLQELVSLEVAFHKYYEVGTMMAQAYISGGPAEGNKAMASFDEAAASLSEKIELFVDQQIKALDTAMEEIISLVGFLRQSVLIAGISAVVIGILVAWAIIVSITKPINKIVASLSQGAEQLASASQQVSSSSQHLADGASNQAASIEETSSSLEEMSAMTKQNADNSQQADNLMKDASKVVDTANDSMGRLTTSMVDISKASEETSRIIKTIDEIAFQTNLLALNAAVEAARAGEAGAGFAVVADEVRNLAMRAADAAKNTAEMIEGTVKKVNEGSELVNTTNEAFTEVADSAAMVGELVGEIAAASREQAQGIDQINTAVVEMDKIVQQTAATAEESASASEEMNAQCVVTNEIVDSLKTLIQGGKGSKTLSRAGDKESSFSNQVDDKYQQSETSLPAKKVNPASLIPLGDGGFRDF